MGVINEIQPNYILGISRQHNSSICVLKDGDVFCHFEEERITRNKHEDVPFHSFFELKKHTNFVPSDLCISGFYNADYLNETSYQNQTIYDVIFNKTFGVHPQKSHHLYTQHHLMHAACAFYNSGFTDAVCVVMDGGGSFVNGRGSEVHSIFTAQYPVNFSCIKKEFDTDTIPPALMFEALSVFLGFDLHSAGKVMGLSSYGVEDKDIPHPATGKLFVLNEFNRYVVNPSIKYLQTKDFQIHANLAYAVQKYTERYALNFIEQALSSGCKNICVSGGYFFNCVANNFIKQQLPADVNLYVEPISGDSGTSIGAAKYVWHKLTNDTTVRKQNLLYHGLSYELPKTFEGFDTQKVTYEDVAKIISEGSIVAMYQGRAESGPRALGNRSLLFDPRVKNGKDVVNVVKKRESFRPFAASILHEHVSEWFDLGNMTESPFMMYTVNCHKDKQFLVPAVVHVDGSCRVQTVTELQNLHFYNLILAFFKLTSIPMLLNTSLNLAGDPLVNSPEDALDTVTNSEIQYLYFPETSQLLRKGNQNG